MRVTKLRRFILCLLAVALVVGMPLTAVSEEHDRPDHDSATADDDGGEEAGSDATADGTNIDDFVNVDNADGNGLTRVNLNSESACCADAWRLVNNSDQANRFEVREGLSTIHMVMEQGSGDVGFGTADPRSRLHVADSGGFQVRLDDGSDSYLLDAFGTSFRIGESGARRQFRIFGNDAPNDALVVRDGIGLGTIAPERNLHITDGASPAVRLDDTGSGQQWDIEALDDLALSDATGGTTPVTVETGAPDDALVVDGSGNVGVGTDSPGNPVTVDAGGDADGKEQVLQLLNNGAPGFELNNTTAGEAWRYAMDVNDRFVVSRAGSGGAEFLIGKQGQVFMGRPFKFFLRQNGNLEIAGTLTEGSDRAAKTDVAPVDPAGVLQALRDLPISTWSYLEAPDEAHLGPMAQDFHELFGLGNDPTKISPRDMAGVALATIQALDADVQAKGARIAELEAEAEAKDARMDDLEERLERLEAASAE